MLSQNLLDRYNSRWLPPPLLSNRAKVTDLWLAFQNGYANESRPQLITSHTIAPRPVPRLPPAHRHSHRRKSCPIAPSPLPPPPQTPRRRPPSPPISRAGTRPIPPAARPPSRARGGRGRAIAIR